MNFSNILITKVRNNAQYEEFSPFNSIVTSLVISLSKES